MFVGMLFALTASQIAISTVELFRGIIAPPVFLDTD